MKTVVCFLALTLLLGFTSQVSGYDFDWPDTTLITWNSCDSVIVLEDMVFAWLTNTADSSDFVDTVTAQGHTIPYWFSESKTLVIQIGSSDTLTTEALYYKNHSMLRYGGPCILLGEDFWPNDLLYADEEEHEQWYLTSDWQPDGYNADVHINWDPVGDAMQNWADEGVVLGIIDNGIDWDNGLDHPDLDDATRITVGEYFSGNSIYHPLGCHGTMVAGLISAEANNDGGTWGMTGVNPLNELVVFKGTGGTLGQFVGIETTAFIILCANYYPDVVNYSRGFYRLREDDPEGMENVINECVWLWEKTFEFLMEWEVELPLFVCAAGNEAEDIGEDVAYPALFAYEGDISGNFDDDYANGYPFVMSVSGIDNNGNHQFCNDDGHKHVSLVAPSDDFIKTADDDWNRNTFPDIPQNIQIWFDDQEDFNGTSFAAPMVTGVAGLVFNQAIAAGENLNPWSVRRILEKTATDINDDLEEEDPWDDPLQGIDDEMGYGILNADFAVNNHDLYEWKMDNDTWYYLSSRVDPVYDDVTRILEDITFDDDRAQRLDILKGWDPDDEIETSFDFDAETNTMANWNVQRMYKIKLQDAGDEDSLLICGQEIGVDVIGATDYWNEINLFDDAGNNGWNWVAYYPDDSRSARDALEGAEGIAVWNDGNASDLYLAKGANGNFYAPDVPFNSLIMNPGEGYEMQLNNNQDVTLRYEVDAPAFAPSPKDEDFAGKRIASPNHFTFTSRTGDFLPIVITSVRIPNRQPTEGDEIGVFVSDTLCVGAATWYDGKIGFAAWKDDETTNVIEGYTNANSLTFRFYDASENEEISELNVSSTNSASEESSILIKDLLLDGAVKEPTLPSAFKLGPVYPNPFNAQTTIHYSLPESSELKLVVHNSNGQEIKVLHNGYSDAGNFRIDFSANDLSSGVYYVSAHAGEYHKTAKMSLIR